MNNLTVMPRKHKNSKRAKLSGVARFFKVSQQSTPTGLTSSLSSENATQTLPSTVAHLNRRRTNSSNDNCPRETLSIDLPINENH